MEMEDRVYLPGHFLQRLPFLYFLQHFLPAQQVRKLDMPLVNSGSVGTIFSSEFKFVRHIFSILANVVV